MRNFYPHCIYWYFQDCQGFLGRVKIGFESVVLSVTTLEAFCPLPRSFRWFSFSHKTFSAVESITEYFAAWHESNFWEITQIFILCLQFNKTMVGFGESWKGSIHQFWIDQSVNWLYINFRHWPWLTQIVALSNQPKLDHTPTSKQTNPPPYRTTWVECGLAF